MRGTLLLTMVNIGLRGSGMCFQIFLSNRIGATGIGLLQLILTVSIFAATVGNCGVRVATLYLTAEECGARRWDTMGQALYCCLIFGLGTSLLTGVGLYAGSAWIATHWIGDVTALSSLRLLAIFLPATCLWSVMSSYFTACSRLSTLVWVQVLDQVVNIGVTLLLLVFWAGDDVERACLTIVGGNGIATLLTLVLLLSIAFDGTIRPGQSPAMWRRLRKLCGPLAVNDTLRSGLSTVENMLIPKGLSRYGASGQEAMAAYGTIVGMVFPVMMFPSVILLSLGDLLVPELAKWRARNNQQRVVGLCDRCLRLGTVFALGVAGLCWSTAHLLGELLYRNPQVGTYLRILAPMILFLYLDAIVDGIHKGLGEQVYCVRVNTLTNLLDVILLWVLLPRLGIGGYIATFTITHIINFYLSVMQLTKVTGYRLPMGFMVKAHLCALGATVFASFATVGQLSLSVTVVTSGASYLLIFAGLLLLSGTFSAKELRWFQQLFRISNL
ncbi:MAG: polysaccharide biosynthesis C-terminal domain-containing protein [Eubacteriales bacterium]